MCCLTGLKVPINLNLTDESAYLHLKQRDNTVTEKSQREGRSAAVTHRSSEVNKLLPHLDNQVVLGHEGAVQALIKLY